MVSKRPLQPSCVSDRPNIGLFNLKNFPPWDCTETRPWAVLGCLLHSRLLFAFALVPCLLGLQGTSQAQRPEPRHSIIRIPLDSHPGVRFPVTILLPNERRVHRLAIISHGLTTNAARRRGMKMPRYRRLEELLIRRGFWVAIPRRPGYGPDGGRFLEDYGNCGAPNYSKSARAIASIISATVRDFTRRYKIEKAKIVLIGHSGGAIGSLAFAAGQKSSIQRMRLLGAINFSGGFGGKSFGIAFNNCATGRLKSLISQLGLNIRVPTLWLYAQNDTYFDPKLSRSMLRIFRQSGGIAEYHLLPPVTKIGHGIIVSDRASVIWRPIVERFLQK